MSPSSRPLLSILAGHNKTVVYVDTIQPLISVFLLRHEGDRSKHTTYNWSSIDFMLHSFYSSLARTKNVQSFSIISFSFYGPLKQHKH